jgi:hypothetical protein
MLRAMLWTAAVILIAVWIVSQPDVAGNTIHAWIQDAITFFQHLAKG